MKKLRKCLLGFSFGFGSIAFANSENMQLQKYHVLIEIRELGETRNCPGFTGWVEENGACVFRFEKTVSSTDVRLDYTGLVGWAKSKGEIDFQYYLGDIDRGFNFKFKIPTSGKQFLFGEKPYRFEIDAGEYASGVWSAQGVVVVSPAR